MKSSIIGGLLFGVLAVALLAGLAMLPAAPAAAQPAASNQMTVNVYPATSISGTTVNTGAPNIDTEDRDVSLTTGWSSVDVFVTADVATAGTLTATLQVSADGVNWVDYGYDYESFTSVWESEGVTSTATASTTIARHTPKIVLSADGTGLITAPLAGARWRVQMTTSAPVTTTVKATLRR